MLEPYHADLEQLVAALPDITPAELQAELERRMGWSPGSQPCTTLSAASASGIKNPWKRPSRTGLTSPKSAGWAALATLQGSGAVRLPRRDRHHTDLARRYGRSPSGARLLAAVPHGHWRAIAGLRQSGIVAPLVLDGPMTGSAFRAYVEQFRSAGARAR